MSNPNPSRTSHTHRRNTFPPPHLSKSIDSSSSSYNPTTHLAKLGISRKTSRARSPPPSLSLPTHPPQHSHSSKTPLSKSALFPKTKPLVSHLDPTTAKRVVSENNPKLVHDVAVKEKEKEKEKGVSNSVVKPMVMMRLGRSRSLCDPKVELSNFFLINGVKLVNADMPPFMQIHAVGCARNTCDSLEKFSSRALALSLKKEFDGEYGPAWHCIVGTSFGSFVTHSVGGFLYFSMDQKLHILLFKTTVERAVPK